MPDLSAISALMTSVKAASEITRSFSDLKSQAEIQNKVIELQLVIMRAQESALDAQTELNTSYDQVRRLKEKINDLEQWGQFASRYTLVEISPKIFVRSLKQDLTSEQPSHWLCPNCFADKKESIIQLESESHGLSKFLCPRCSFKFTTGTWSPPSIKRTRSNFY